jgi:hypothetical protein
LLQGSDVSLGLLQCLIQKQRPLHHQVGGIGLFCNGSINQPLRFGILIDAPDLNELSEKAFEQGAFLWSHGPPHCILRSLSD